MKRSTPIVPDELLPYFDDHIRDLQEQWSATPLDCFLDKMPEARFDEHGTRYLVLNEDNPDIGVIHNINIYDESKSYKNIQPSGYAYFEKKYLEQYATNLQNSGIAYTYTTYQDVSAIEYTFDQQGLPTKAIIFLKNKKSYLIQVGTRKNLSTKFSSLKSSFAIL